MSYLHPSVEMFSERYNQQSASLVWETLSADVLTPISVALRFYSDQRYFSLFESVEKTANRSRYSCIAMDAMKLWKCDASGRVTLEENGNVTEDSSCNPLESLTQLFADSAMDIPKQLPAMASGLFGYMGYDMVRHMEAIPCNNPDALNVPESIFFIPGTVIVFDNVKDELHIVVRVEYKATIEADRAYQRAESHIREVINTLSQPIEIANNTLVSSVSGDQIFSFESIASNQTKESFCAAVDKAKTYIEAGDIFQVVLSQRFAMEFDCDPFLLYRTLRRLNPSPYSFFMKMDDFTLVGSSPETLVKVENGEMTVRPIAGTRWRGKTPQEDEALAKELLADEKECAEHLMLLDLGRNDVGRVSQIGTVEVVERMQVDYYSHVMHVVSKVKGVLQSHISAIDALQAGFPAGTVSGAPKIRAMEVIDQLENTKRSFYAGAVGYLSATGDIDTCIALRTGLVKDNMFYVQAGGGVVADSVPEAEYEESQNKAKALLLAAQMAMQSSKGGES